MCLPGRAPHGVRVTPAADGQLHRPDTRRTPVAVRLLPEQPSARPTPCHVPRATNGLICSLRAGVPDSRRGSNLRSPAVCGNLVARTRSGGLPRSVCATRTSCAAGCGLWRSAAYGATFRIRQGWVPRVTVNRCWTACAVPGRDAGTRKE